MSTLAKIVTQHRPMKFRAEGLILWEIVTVSGHAEQRWRKIVDLGFWPKSQYALACQIVKLFEAAPELLATLDDLRCACPPGDTLEGEPLAAYGRALYRAIELVNRIEMPNG